MKRATWIILAAILLAVAAVVAVGIMDMQPGAQAQKLISDNRFYEAYQNISENGLEERYSDNQSVMFYVAMANHEACDRGDSQWVLPDVTGWSCAEIASALKNVGQAYRVEYTQAPQSFANEVVAQRPPGGQMVSKDDVVVLTANTYHSSNNVLEWPFPAAGLIAEIGEWVYCVQNQSVCRFRADGSDKTVLWENTQEDRRIRGLYAGGDRLYCVLQKYEQEDIDEVLSLSLDGGSTPLGELPFSMEYRAYGSRFYLALEGVQMYDAETDEVTQISEEYLCFIEADGYTYSITQDENEAGELTNYLKRKRTDGSGEEETLAASPYIFGVYAQGEDIYYLAVQNDPAETECLLKYTGGEPERLKILGYDGDSWVQYLYIRQWRNKLLLPGRLGSSSFIYDMDTGETHKIRTADLINSDLTQESPGMVCGNYLYYNYTPSEDGYARLNALAPVRYNLMTGEEEAFLP